METGHLRLTHTLSLCCGHLRLTHTLSLLCCAAACREHWRLMSLMHEEHSKHEDMVIFKAYNDIFPFVARPYNSDHEEHHVLIHK